MKLKIEYVDINSIKPYENNPRFNDDAVEYVVNSIKEFGFKVPIIIDKNNIIVAGHTRYKASLELGLKEVPCIIADDLDENQIKAFRLADNKVGDFSIWDYEKLKDEIESVNLDNYDIDLSDFNFSDIYEVLDDTGLLKNENKIKDTFTSTFSIRLEYKKIFDNFISTHSKEDLNILFLNAIKRMMKYED